MNASVPLHNQSRPVCILSLDFRLTGILSAALCSEYPVVPLSPPDGQQLTASAGAVLIDIGSVSTRASRNALKQAQDCGVPAIVLADNSDEKEALNLVSHGAFSYVRKPLHLRELRGTICAAFQ